MSQHSMLWSCIWSAPLRCAAVVSACIGLLLGFDASSHTASSAAPTATAETPPMPQWLREALNRLPANVRDNPAGVDRLYISRDAGPWTGDDMALLARFPDLKSLEIVGLVSPEALTRLKELVHLERIRLYSHVTDEDLKLLASLPGLKSLVLPASTRFTETGMKYLSESKSLEELEIPYWSDVTLVRHLEGMNGLKVLRLSVSPLTEAKVAAIAKLKGPAALDLCLDLPRPDVSADRVLTPLRGMANIEGLTLYWHGPQWDAALAVIESLTNLKRLDLQNTKVSDADLARLAALVNLRELNLHGVPITDAGLAHLRPLVRMQKLDLCNAHLTDASGNIFRNMTELRELNLSGASIGDATVGVLGGLEHLESLELGGNTVSTAGLARLAGLKNLKYLGLGVRGKVNDQALIPIGKITSLEELRLGSYVTDKGIRFLAGLKNLRKLNLVSCDVTRKATMETLKEIKGLEVTFTGEGFQEYETLIVGAKDGRP